MRRNSLSGVVPERLIYNKCIIDIECTYGCSLNGVIPEGLIYNECIDVECTYDSSLSGVIPEGLIYSYTHMHLQTTKCITNHNVRLQTTIFIYK